MRKRIAFLGAVGLGVILGVVCSRSMTELGVEAQSPTEALAERDIYYPGTEDLAPDEMRLVACGTGMPNARPK